MAVLFSPGTHAAPIQSATILGPYEVICCRVRTSGEARLSTSEEAMGPMGNYDVGVAITSFAEGEGPIRDDRQGPTGGAIPGYDEALGRRLRPQRSLTHIERGDEAVRIATDAIANQIGIAAQRIATGIGQQMLATDPESFLLEEVEVSFGVTLAAGIQTLFTAQAESSAQVTVRLSRPVTGELGDR